MDDKTDAGDVASGLTVTLIERLLDWPFLFFLLIASMFVIARTEFFSLLSSRQIEFEVGGQKLKLGDAVEKLDQQTDITQEDLDALQEQIDALKQKADPERVQKEKADLAAIQSAPPPPEADVISRLRNGLKNHRYTWRSIERLALIAGVTEARAYDLLDGQPDIKIGRGKSGRRIARFL